ncbi:MAG: hypothetical protein AAB378_01450 [Patescibacteria group bacterium]
MEQVITTTSPMNQTTTLWQSEIFKSLITTDAFWYSLIFLICFIIFLVKFGKQIGELIPKIRRVGLGKNTIDMGTDEKEEVKKEEQVSEKKYEEEKKATEKKEEPFIPQTLEEWRYEMMFAFLDKDKERAEKAYKKVLELDNDELSKKKNEILYLKLSHTLGDTFAIPELKKYLNGKDTTYEANIALGFCYASSDDFENANLFFTKALETSDSDEDISLASTHYASSLYRNNEKDKSIEVLIKGLSRVKDNESRVKIYVELADIYEKEKDYENRAFVIDKALELKPNDSDLLFKAGYSYSQSKYEELSLLHYKNARQINPNNENVQNNLGVQYESLSMPIKSISSYKEAEKLNETLASANLAYRLMDAGFANEAMEKLNKAKIQNEPHPNVGAAISDLPKRKEKEEETEQRCEKTALEMRKFILGFTEAKFNEKDDIKSISGNWKSDKNITYQFEIDGNKIKSSWKNKLLSNFEYDWKFEGEVFNNSALITFFENEYDFFKKEYEYKKQGVGFLFYTPSDETIKIMEGSDSYKTKKIYILKKHNKPECH